MHISTEHLDQALVWQINRAERRNALGTIIAHELWEKVQQLQIEMATWQSTEIPNPPRYRCLVLTAKPIEGPSPIWIAGGDLQELSQLRSGAEARQYAETMTLVCSSLQSLPIPVIASIDGLAIGGGIELALAADIRICTGRSEFHFKQLEMGLATGYGSAKRLVQLIGLSRAMDSLLRCRQVKAAQALEWGLVQETFTHGEAMHEGLLQMIKQLTALSPQSLAVQKQMLQGLAIQEQERRTELDLFTSLWMQPFHKAKIEGFIKKP